MPGFNVQPYGGGFSSAGPSNTIEVRRKHRWVFESLGRGEGAFSQAELLVLQSASRPSIKFEEPSMHHNQEQIYLAGKHTWEPVKLVWYDSEQSPDCSRGLYHWIETVVNVQSMGVAHPRFYKRQAQLAVLDGIGRPTERWIMYGTWATACNWQELDYAATELLTLEATMRFDRAIRQCITSPTTGNATTPSCP
jgi:hypothetical protein